MTTKKKDTTRPSRKGTQGRSKTRAQTSAAPQAEEITVRFPFGSLSKIEELIPGWQKDGEIYARLLANNDCPVAFREAFKAIFYDQLLPMADFGHPLNITAFFPLILISAQGSHPIEADTIVQTLIHLRETLAAELSEKVLAEVRKEGR